MPNQWNKAIDGFLNGVSSVADGITRKNQREETDNQYKLYKQKLMESYSQFLNTNAKDNNIQSSDTANKQNELSQQDQMSVKTPIKFNPFALYTQLLDFKTSMVNRPMGNQYSQNAQDLFNLLFGNNFVKKNISDKIHPPEVFANMSYEDTRSLNNRQIFKNFMHLNPKVRNQVLRTNTIARKAFRKHTGRDWSDDHSE